MTSAARAGLTAAEASARLRAEGPNELARDRAPGLLATAAGVLKEPMLLLLLGAGAIYLLLGDVQEALVLLLFVGVIIAITLTQERKTERALGALRDLSSPRALVLRDGAPVRIAGREVVRGDLLLLAEGDRIPADGSLVEAAHLEVDESLLTGESAPVRKEAGGEAAVFAGTLVVRGRGTAEVRATGAASEMGRIGASLAEVDPGRTPLQEEVGAVVRRIAAGGLALCAVLVVVYGLVRGGWLDGLLAGIALAMAVLPEELPVVLTLFMALGAWRISRSRVLTRRLPAIEALGAATVLCSDKTGTLTENRMTVVRLWAAGVPEPHRVGGDGPLPPAARELVELGVLASQRDPFDPMEQAFHRLGRAAGVGVGVGVGEEGPGAGRELLREYPLSPELLAVSHVWRSPAGGASLVAAKGAPVAIADVCHLEGAALAELRARAAALGEEGLRVIAVARADAGGELPDHPHAFEFRLAGLVALEDPVRPGVPEAVAECAAAGVRVMMITGDSPDTARAIARQVGIPGADEVVTGPELASLTDEELRQRLPRVSVCARTVPAGKLRLVQALRARGEVVAMTGDGVNDAPALKAAHIGVAMGGRGTDVAREAAALIVTDDDFGSIVAAIRLGRRIYENLRRAMAYVVAVHVPIAGLALLPVLLGWPLVLFPVHIVFLELVIDPACSVAFEAEPGDPGLMQRRPRAPAARLFQPRLVLLALAQGAALLAATLVAFRMGVAHTGAEASGRALAFSTLVAGNVGLILVNRSWRRSLLSTLRVPNRASWLVVVGATAALAAAVAVPAVRALFRFGAASGDDLVLAAALGLASVVWLELVKAARPAWLAAP